MTGNLLWLIILSLHKPNAYVIGLHGFSEREQQLLFSLVLYIFYHHLHHHYFGNNLKMRTVLCLLLVFKLSPCCSNDKLSSGYFPGVWVLKADVSEHCVRSIFNRWWSVSHFTTCWRWNRHSVLKRCLLILRRQGNTQKTIYLSLLLMSHSSKKTAPWINYMAYNFFLQTVILSV